jgi:hypothetical protein
MKRSRARNIAVRTIGPGAMAVQLTNIPPELDAVGKPADAPPETTA